MPDTFTVKTMWNGAQRDITCKNSSSKHHIDNVDRLAVASALLGEDFHKSSKIKSLPTGADVYLHIKTSLYALKKSDVKSNAKDAKKPAKGEDPTPVEISFTVLGTGSVNAGVHNF